MTTKPDAFNGRLSALFGDGNDPEPWSPPPIETPWEERRRLNPQMRPPTPWQAFRFFLSNFIGYGFISGMLYGTGVGVFVFVIGALFGFEYGSIAGTALGVFDGVVIGLYAVVAYARGASSDVIVRRVCWIAPMLTYPCALLITMSVPNVFYYPGYSIRHTVCNPLLQLCCVLAAYAAWDASKRMLKRFTELYA
jgi:hypothetical protein